MNLPAGVEALLTRRLSKVSSRFRGPFASLLKKEFRLQQVSFLLAGVFFLIAVAGFCVVPLYEGLGAGILGGDYGTFVVVLPLVAGAMALAEEKGWGLSEWHLTLPPSARQQWSAKMLATLPTSVGLGLLLPAAMFLAGNALSFPHGSRAPIPPVYDLAALVLSQLLLTSVAVYAASCSKTTLRAILVALGLMVAGLGVSALAVSWAASRYLALVLVGLLFRGHSGMPVLCVSLLLMVCLTQWFAWSNFRCPGAPVRRQGIQFLLLLIAAGLASLAITAAVHLAHPGEQATPFRSLQAERLSRAPRLAATAPFTQIVLMVVANRGSNHLPDAASRGSRQAWPAR